MRLTVGWLLLAGSTAVLDRAAAQGKGPVNPFGPAPEPEPDPGAAQPSNPFGPPPPPAAAVVPGCEPNPCRNGGRCTAAGPPAGGGHRRLQGPSIVCVCDAAWNGFYCNRPYVAPEPAPLPAGKAPEPEPEPAPGAWAPPSGWGMVPEPEPVAPMACPAGQFADRHRGGCVDCPAGKYLETPGSDSRSDCIDCMAGKYSAAAGSDSTFDCIDCMAGKFVGVPGSDEEADCLACPAGSDAPTPGSSQCTRAAAPPPPALPTPIDTSGVFMSGEVTATVHQDWHSFDAVKGQTYQLETEMCTGRGCLEDTVMELIDRDQSTLLIENDDDERVTDRLDSFIEWTCPASGTYFVVVSAYLSQSAGTEHHQAMTSTACFPGMSLTDCFCMQARSRSR